MELVCHQLGLRGVLKRNNILAQVADSFIVNVFVTQTFVLINDLMLADIISIFIFVLYGDTY